jgi:hypothetical protein
MTISITFTQESFIGVIEKLRVVKFIKDFSNIGLKEAKERFECLNVFDSSLSADTKEFLTANSYTIWYEMTPSSFTLLNNYIGNDIEYQSIQFHNDWNTHYSAMTIASLLHIYLKKSLNVTAVCIGHNAVKAENKIFTLEYDTSENHLFTFKSK